jgi:peptidyl-prolyl cis-trans isomerase C
MGETAAMKRFALPVLISCVLSLAGALALSRPRVAAQDHPDPTQPAAVDAGAPLSPAEQSRRAAVIAKVGEVRITVGEVEDALNAQSPFLRARYRDPAKRAEFVDNMIRFELLAREAVKRHYDRDPEVLRTVKQNAVQTLIRKEFDERITIETIPQADVDAYYASHAGEFNRAEMRRASHILVATREEAERLSGEARSADVRTFRDLAREHSLDVETKLRGGDLRYFTRARQPDPATTPSADAEVVQELVDAAFALREVGDTSAPVQVGDKWSVVKLTGLRPAETRTVADAGPSIRMRLWRERRQKSLDDFVLSLRTRLNPEVHAERVDPIRLDPLPAGAGLAGFPGDDDAHGTTKIAPRTPDEAHGGGTGGETPAPTAPNAPNNAR